MTPTNPEADERLIVEQSDREAAADHYAWENGGPSSYSDSMRRGGEDHGHRVLAFARHRILALTAANARIAALEAELARRDANENRNCLNWGPCSRHDGKMLGPDDVMRTLANGGAA